MMTKTNYQAFLLRIWRENDSGPWRASLDNPQLGKRQNFATLADLMAFLHQSTNENETVCFPNNNSPKK
jgi:hypothetical protein